MIRTTQLNRNSSGNVTVVNITDAVRDFVTSTRNSEGQVVVFYKHTTGARTARKFHLPPDCELSGGSIILVNNATQNVALMNGS
jgi:hypothetical protein